MPINTILLILLALVAAISIAAFQYFYKAKGGRRQNLIFTFLRFTTVFAVLLLLINPKIRNVEYFTEKPRLVIAVDNSASIAYAEKADSVQEFVNFLTKDPELRERFEVQVFGFGSEVTKDPALSFEDKQTHIPPLFKNLRDLYETSRAPTVLISDGNQTLGEDFLYSAAGYPQPIYPVVVGDTSALRDLVISRVNSNKYAFLKNRFPVEILLSYTGEKTVETRLVISKNGQQVFSQAVSFNGDDNAAVIQADLEASSVGVHRYIVELLPFPEEENVLNNSKEFAIEVVDERTKILLLYETLHPDLGTFKRSIETNEQREVLLQRSGEGPINPEDHQLIILYEPTSTSSEVLKEIQAKGKNLWIITGLETDWGMLNEQQELVRQEITGQSEEFQPVYNSNFALFQNEDIGFSEFPPLTGNFGELHSSVGLNELLYQKIQGVETTAPLLAIAEDKNTKTAFLFGSGIWKWRSHVYREYDSFEPFDEFLGKVVQFLSSGKRKDRLSISYEPLYQSTEELVITAEYFDRNYVFDPDAKINLSLKEEATGEKRQIPFLLRNNRYEVQLGSLSPGDYSFSVTVAGEGLSRAGNFSLSTFDVEKQFSRANLEAFRSIAEDKGQKIYFLNKVETLKKELLNTKSYLPVQKSRENNVPLIDWYYLLGIIIFSLGVEWFLRKYYGYI